jgi:hypothetical protein
MITLPAQGSLTCCLRDNSSNWNKTLTLRSLRMMFPKETWMILETLNASMGICHHPYQTCQDNNHNMLILKYDWTYYLFLNQMNN